MDSNDRPHATTPTSPEWQFSLRSLFIVTTVVSVCLAISVHLAGLMAIVAVVGLIQAGMLLAGDWLIRPANRRALAFVTAGSWMVLGSGLVILGCYAIYEARGPGSLFGYLLPAAAAGCYYVAFHRWRKLTALRRAIGASTDA
jgi:hypothetical protein